MNYDFTSSFCQDLFPSIERQQILSIANSENWSLPEEYIDFLAEHNGMQYFGESQGKLLAYQHCMDLAIHGEIGFKLPFTIWPQEKLHSDSSGFIDLLYGFSLPRSAWDLRETQKHYAFDICVPHNFLAIGGSNDTNQVVLAMSGEWQGKIFQWPPSPDPEWPAEQNTLRRLFFVANSFREFWAGLAEVPSATIEG